MSVRPGLTPDTVHRIALWLLSGDTGVSSETIVRVAMGADGRKGLPDDISLDAPYDAHDFGRCYRLLKAIPELRPEIERTGKRVKAWAPVAKHWDELVALYERELSTGRMPLTYQRLTELRRSP